MNLGEGPGGFVETIEAPVRYLEGICEVIHYLRDVLELDGDGGV